MQNLTLNRKSNTIGVVLVPEGFDPEHVRLVFSAGECALFIHGNLNRRSNDANVIAKAFNDFFEFRQVKIDAGSFCLFMH